VDIQGILKACRQGRNTCRATLAPARPARGDVA